MKLLKKVTMITACAAIAGSVSAVLAVNVSADELTPDTAVVYSEPVIVSDPVLEVTDEYAVVPDADVVTEITDEPVTVPDTDVVTEVTDEPVTVPDADYTLEYSEKNTVLPKQTMCRIIQIL